LCQECLNVTMVHFVAVLTTHSYCPVHVHVITALCMNRYYCKLIFRDLHKIRVMNIINKRYCSWFQTFAMFWMLYAFLWVIPQRLNSICRRFRTLCLFHLHRQVGMSYTSYIPCLWRWNRQSVQKCQHIEFRLQVITQKKAYKMYCSMISFTLLIYHSFSVCLVCMLPLIPHSLLYISFLLVTLSCPSSP